MSTQGTAEHELHIIILAAGQGKRMGTSTPKVLHKLGGKPMLERVIGVACKLQPKQIHVVIGHAGEQIKNTLTHLPVHWVVQHEQLGTGHAVMQAFPYIPYTSHVLVLSGDVPCIQVETLQALMDYCLNSPDKQTFTLLTALLPDPTGFGRIIRTENEQIAAIIEEKDASAAQRLVQEIYSGVCCIPAATFHRWLPQLSCNNAQGEYYLTETIAIAVAENYPIAAVRVPEIMEVQGVNDCLQLQQLERAWQQYQAYQLMRAGVVIADANRIDIRGELRCGKDIFIDINTIFQGEVVVGNNCTIEANCLLTNVELGDHCTILANSVLENCKIGDHCQIGPFARIRTGTQIATHCKIGNFVETKNAIIASGSKASHLSYLGDVKLGKEVNIGAGTITCNYDGANKHYTIIEDGVFIGSGTQLIAPLVVGEYATIGAGSTIRKSVPPGELTLTEAKQRTVHGWVRPNKKKNTVE